MRSPLLRCCTLMSCDCSVMTGFKPRSTPRLSAKGDTPYRLMPGRTQSACVSGQASTPAELAMLRSPGKYATAAQRHRLAQTRDRECIAFMQGARDVDDAVTIGVGLDHRHHATTARRGPHRAKIMSQGVEIDEGLCGARPP